MYYSIEVHKQKIQISQQLKISHSFEIAIPARAIYYKCAIADVNPTLVIASGLSSKTFFDIDLFTLLCATLFNEYEQYFELTSRVSKFMSKGFTCLTTFNDQSGDYASDRTIMNNRHCLNGIFKKMGNFH
jgi:hypothetical protein